MGDYRINISEPADNDIRDTIRYISTQLLEPATALEMLDTFQMEIKTLSTFPHRCPLVNDERLARLGYRILQVKNYLVFFSINEKDNIVDIERILYQRRNWKHLL